MVRITGYSGALAGKAGAYRKFGEQEAAKHRPASEALHPDTHEVSLRSEAEGLVATEQRIFDTVMADADRSILDVRSRVTEVTADIQKALADNTLAGEVDASLADERSGLVESAAERIRREVDLRAFKAENSITALAHYPESLIWHWAIVAALALAETVANAFFYENANGLIGGFMVALSVSAVNMLSATILGSQFRRKNLVAAQQRYFGWFCLVIFVPLALFCNALFAAFRSAYQALLDPQDPLQLREGFKAAWTDAGRFFLFDFQFKDMSSFILFMIGIVLSLLAFWKGYTSDDPYPGYSKRDRALKAAKQAEDHLRSGIRNKIKDRLHSYRIYVQGLASATGTLVASVTRSIAEVDLAQRNLVANANAIQRDYHLVLDGYRQANLAIRGTEPPAYFSQKPEILSSVSTEAAQSRVSELNDLLGSLEALQAQHRDALNQKISELQTQATEIQANVFDTFLAGVERDAEGEVQRNIQIIRTIG